MAAEKNVMLSEQEVENLISACWAQISEFTIGKEEKEPFQLLIAKLEGVKNGS